MNSPRWNIPDLVDLEFFLDRDEDGDLDSLARRDREISAGLAAQQTAEPASHATLLFGWLTARRKSLAESGETVLPGRVWQELMVLFSWAILIIGLVSGAALAFSFLSYSGTRPVNISTYFGVFVVFEFALFVLLIVLSLYRRVLGKTLESSFLYTLLRRLFCRLFTRLSSRTAARASAESRMQWAARSGSFRRLQQRYGTLLMRPFFLLAQLFGVSFNCGVLAATLLKVIGSDVAFGWQTTLQVTGESLYTLVRWISLPWNWALPSGCPTLEQIEGSRLILKNGIYSLATHDLISWWPFLCLSVFVYGLLPRLVLLLAGVIQQHRALSALRFDQGRYRQLLHRMRTPLVSTTAPQETEKTAPAPRVSAGGEVEQRVQTPAAAAQETRVLALVPDEIFADCSRDELQRQVRAELGYEVAAVLPFWTLEKTEDEEIALVRQKMADADCTDILLLQEAWQPPIQELLTFFTRLRSRIGDRPLFIIGLVGKPANGTLFTPVSRLNMQIWQQKIAALADPGLQLAALVRDDA